MKSTNAWFLWICYLVWTAAGVVSATSTTSSGAGSSGSGSASAPPPTTTTTQHDPTTTRTTTTTTTTTTSRRTGTSGNSGIPRSNHDDHSSHRWAVYPPWNPSHNITEHGFLRHEFWRIPGEWEKEVRLRTIHSLDRPCRIRQVPGDGNCLFHSISLCLCHAQNGTHWDLKTRLAELYEHSQGLRQQAVACLNDAQRRLVLQGHEIVKSRELVQAAASQYDLSCDEYCRDMLQESVWGGGPEIVALTNCLKRPIHVYELVTVSGQFRLRRMACFGSPRFDVRGQDALHILSADSRFPDLQPGKQLSDGNHFLAVFPIHETEDDDEDAGDGARRRQKKRRKRLRGGSFWGIGALRQDKKSGQEEDIAKPGPEYQWMGGWWRRSLL